MAKKNIAEIDKNLAVTGILPEGTKLFNVLNEPFEIYGLHDPKGTGRFERMPLYMQKDESINEGARRLMTNTAGGRVRFMTDSKTVAIKVSLGNRTVFSHMPATGVCGFDMYAECDGTNRYAKTFVPPQDASVTEYESAHTFEDNRLRMITINFPLYNDVQQLYIGLEETAQLLPPKKYSIEKPVVFYGSSVTQGGCASRPGMCHAAVLSRWLDCDHINLGFSGSDRGETAMAEYMKDLPMSVFVHGYGYNAPSLQHYADTYYPFYKIIREKNPTLPIVMMSNPVSVTVKEPKRADYLVRRREITMQAFIKALGEGDKNVYFVDGAASLGGILDAEDATVDGTHPTDLGFYNMAKTMYPLLRRLIFNGEEGGII